MSGSEEFDWDRMREEESRYFSMRATLKTVEPAIKATLEKSMDASKETADRERIRELRKLPYEQYLQTDHWKHLRRLALERDGHQCRICHSRKGLEVHHRTYVLRGEERLFDLLSLCGGCHRAHHKRAIDAEAAVPAMERRER